MCYLFILSMLFLGLSGLYAESNQEVLEQEQMEEDDGVYTDDDEDVIILEEDVDEEPKN